jgi:hypothetical protein
MRRSLLVPATAALIFALGGSALAGPEWCDDGSPPPNDFFLRPTGSGSGTSSTSWLNSTTSGSLSFTPYINTLDGGVAAGMDSALLNATPYTELPPSGD